MASVNKAIIVGNLGKDPEVTYSQGGKAVANFSIATTEEWKDKVSGEKKSVVEWHRIVCFNRLAEICGEYLHKGKQVYIEGALQTTSWEKDGITRYTTKIIARTMQMLGSKNDSDGGSQRQNNQGPSGSGGGMPNMPPPEDDIPF